MWLMLATGHVSGIPTAPLPTAANAGCALQWGTSRSNTSLKPYDESFVSNYRAMLHVCLLSCFFPLVLAYVFSVYDQERIRYFMYLPGLSCQLHVRAAEISKNIQSVMQFYCFQTASASAYLRERGLFCTLEGR
jgi:hypothetical protein